MPKQQQIVRPAVLAAATVMPQTDEEADWSGVTVPPPKNCQSVDALDVLVDKSHPLPLDYIPKDLVSIGNFQLRSEAANQLNTIINSAKTLGLSIHITSAYRSFTDQQKLYTPAKTLTAAPAGFSEHQLGTAVDLTVTYPSKEWTWLDQNAHYYGFVLSYRYNQTETTGYKFEPWHWRYVGSDLAFKIRTSKSSPQSFYKALGCN